MKIKNSKELDTWLFEHAQIQGHKCLAVKVPIGDGEFINTAWQDFETGERIEIEYE